jgi:hypothetical protein
MAVSDLCRDGKVRLVPLEFWTAFQQAAKLILVQLGFNIGAAVGTSHAAARLDVATRGVKPGRTLPRSSPFAGGTALHRVQPDSLDDVALRDLPRSTMLISAAARLHEVMRGSVVEQSLTLWRPCG